MNGHQLNRDASKIMKRYKNIITLALGVIFNLWVFGDWFFSYRWNVLWSKYRESNLTLIVMYTFSMLILIGLLYLRVEKFFNPEKKGRLLFWNIWLFTFITLWFVLFFKFFIPANFYTNILILSLAHIVIIGSAIEIIFHKLSSERKAYDAT